MKAYNYIIFLINFSLIVNVLNNNLNAQQKSNFSFHIGTNINNPHQLIENTNSTYDVNEQKAMGSLFGAIGYKSKFLLILNNEISQTNVKFGSNNDLFLNGRIYLLKKLINLKPFIETGFLINTYGDNNLRIENLFGFIVSNGIIFKLNKYVYLDFSINYVYKEYKFENLNFPQKNLDIETKIDRFNLKTGLIFNLL